MSWHWYDEIIKIIKRSLPMKKHNVESFRGVSQDCINLIEHFEGKVNEAYPDVAHGWRVATVGIGFTEGVKQGDYMTDKEIYARLAKELKRFEYGVKNSVNVPITQGMFDACVSFSFNLGNGAFARSTLLKKLNQGDYDGASNEFHKWVNAGGKKLLGLQRRRDAERLLFLGKDWKSYKREF